jgi:hypothetical protein
VYRRSVKLGAVVRQSAVDVIGSSLQVFVVLPHV